MARSLVSVVFLAVCVLLVVVAFVRLVPYRKMISVQSVRKSFSLNKIFRLWMIPLGIVFALIYFVLSGIASGKEATATIILNYDDASKGLAMNKTRYNMSEIIGDDVLNEAIEKGGWEISKDDLRECLTVAPTMQGDSLSGQDDTSDNSGYHVSTEYNITFDSFANRSALKLNAQDAVSMIAQCYREFFIKKYSDNYTLLNVELDSEMMENADYLDISEYLKVKAHQVEGYMDELSNRYSAFTTGAGESFASISSKVYSLETTQIGENLDAYLLYNGISKDPDAYIGRLEYNNMNTDFQKRRDKASYDTRNQAISMYAEEMTRVVLVPTWDTDGEYYMGRTKVGIDQLSVEAQEYSAAVASDQQSIDTNKTIISAMQNSNTAGSDSRAEELIEAISQNLQDFGKTAKSAALENYGDKQEKCIGISIEKASWRGRALTAAGYGILLVIALMVAGYMDTLRNAVWADRVDGYRRGRKTRG